MISLADIFRWPFLTHFYFFAYCNTIENVLNLKDEDENVLKFKRDHLLSSSDLLRVTETGLHANDVNSQVVEVSHKTELTHNEHHADAEIVVSSIFQKLFETSLYCKGFLWD